MYILTHRFLPKISSFTLSSLLYVAVICVGFSMVFGVVETNNKNILTQANIQTTQINPNLNLQNQTQIGGITDFKIATQPKVIQQETIQVETKQMIKPETKTHNKIEPNVNLETINITNYPKNKIQDDKKTDFDKETKRTNIPLTITIPKIGIDNLKIASGSINNLDDLYPKMDQKPVLENYYAGDFCTKRAYLMGHSEPSYKGQVGAGIKVFERLEELEVGDIFNATDSTGKTCDYKVQKWDFVRTDSEDGITQAQFDYLFYPLNTENTLTIQTCQKGSSTVRLIMRAVMI
jgi:hypothetical protein